MAKCKLFDFCPLRIFYEATGNNDDWLKTYCNGKFKECGRYKLEIIEGLKIHGMPPEMKKRRRKRK